MKEEESASSRPEYVRRTSTGMGDKIERERACHLSTNVHHGSQHIPGVSYKHASTICILLGDSTILEMESN